jgi:hypothetical protein
MGTVRAAARTACCPATARWDSGVPDCAGITRSFFCARCNFEGRLLGGRLYERCTLTNRMSAALDDGSGRVAPAMLPLFELVRGMDKPRCGLNWLDNPQVPELLAALARGQVGLSHEALHELPNWRTVAYLRDLLMSCGTLPALDKQLLHFRPGCTIGWPHTPTAPLQAAGPIQPLAPTPAADHASSCPPDGSPASSSPMWAHWPSRPACPSPPRAST